MHHNPYFSIPTITRCLQICYLDYIVIYDSMMPRSPVVANIIITINPIYHHIPDNEHSILILSHKLNRHPYRLTNLLSINPMRSPQNRIHNKNTQYIPPELEHRYKWCPTHHITQLPWHHLNSTLPLQDYPIIQQNISICITITESWHNNTPPILTSTICVNTILMIATRFHPTDRQTWKYHGHQYSLAWILVSSFQGSNRILPQTHTQYSHRTE